MYKNIIIVIILVLFAASWGVHTMRTESYQQGYDEGRKIGYKEGIEVANQLNMTNELNRLRKSQ